MRRLRSALPEGSPRWAARLAHWRVLGLEPDALEKPKIAVVNSSAELAVCYSHLDTVAQRVKAAIRRAGGIPFEIRTVAPSDFITSVGAAGGYILSARDLIAFDIEVMVEGAMLDGMICLSSCDKTLPGHLIAAARLDIPTLILPCGYQPHGHCAGEPVDVEDIFIRASQYLIAPDPDLLSWIRACAPCSIAGPGVCSGLGTANTMHMLAEALGMALFGTTPVRALSPKFWETVERAGSRIVELVMHDVRPSRILSPSAFRNAIAVLLAIGGSLNAVKHLQAIATAGNIDIDVFAELQALYERVPLLTEVRPNGTTSIEDLERAGGTAAVLRELSPLLDLRCDTIDGRSLGELVGSMESIDPHVIGSLAYPKRPRSTLMPVEGSLAPRGALVRSTAWVQERRDRRFIGQAMLFDDQSSVLAALKAQRIPPGTAIILRGLGPRGQAGMGMAGTAALALASSPLVESCILITDGQISGLINRGLVVAEVTPEAVSEASPLGRLRDGDRIAVDLEQRRVDVLVDDTILWQREPFQQNEPPPRGWLAVYATLVRDVRDGALVDGRRERRES
ncbi:dihydroxy-acid dehydratase [Thermomicrobium sp. CFH 73360]|uniref:dihydroxy-acid dehydratase domain-containing protein n=1 Tax=Thermomicrobium sp. CFH 73360 TaxID=2951987 RepID=UPI0020776EC3|nr:dihydroxy-acid dehydratase [Thermomicrobium sp. CFH 73360]MCM8746803.1 dihydroxy-acid dehydratase [Thermomicrobium sp. CFH 73360]